MGWLGELHPEVIEALKLKGRPVYAEIDIEAVFNDIEKDLDRRVKPAPRFPAVMRDIALVVSETVTAGEVAEAVLKAAEGLAEEVALFDVYRGATIPPGRKSLAFHVVYREPTATLTDSRVDKAHEVVTRAIERKFGGMVRTGS